MRACVRAKLNTTKCIKPKSLTSPLSSERTVRAMKTQLVRLKLRKQVEFVHSNTEIFGFFQMKLCSSLRQKSGFVGLFFGLLCLRGVRAAKRLLKPRRAGSVAPSPPPEALPAANSNTNNEGVCVFHCGCWSLSLSAAVQA